MQPTRNGALPTDLSCQALSLLKRGEKREVRVCGKVGFNQVGYAMLSLSFCQIKAFEVGRDKYSPVLVNDKHAVFVFRLGKCGKS